jgi:hypothetical protein
VCIRLVQANPIEGVIVAARNIETQELAAIKLEPVDPTKQVLKLEVSTLKKLQSVYSMCSV